MQGTSSLHHLLMGSGSLNFCEICRVSNATELVTRLFTHKNTPVERFIHKEVPASGPTCERHYRAGPQCFSTVYFVLGLGYHIDPIPLVYVFHPS
jgi:hypothetical protein